MFVPATARPVPAAFGAVVPVAVAPRDFGQVLARLAPFVQHMGLVVGPLPIGWADPEQSAVLLFARGAGGADTVARAASRVADDFAVEVGPVEEVSASPWW